MFHLLQVISSQVDSEEEWKVVQLRGSNTPVEKSPESSLPTELKQAPVSEESPAVLVAGDRVCVCVYALLKMGRYYNTTMCHYWDMSVK